MARKMMPIRQGDVWLIPLTKSDDLGVFKSAIKMQTVVRQTRARGGGLILAEGEATGHHHRVRGRNIRVYQASRGRQSIPGLPNTSRVLVSPKRGCTITHEEHATLDIPEGTYKVVIAREYTPSANVRVRD